MTNGLVPQTWPTFDREGFDGVQRSMVNFGKHVFSKFEIEFAKWVWALTSSQVWPIEMQGCWAERFLYLFLVGS